MGAGGPGGSHLGRERRSCGCEQWAGPTWGEAGHSGDAWPRQLGKGLASFCNKGASEDFSSKDNYTCFITFLSCNLMHLHDNWGRASVNSLTNYSTTGLHMKNPTSRGCSPEAEWKPRFLAFLSQHGWHPPAARCKCCLDAGPRPSCCLAVSSLVEF